MPEQPSPSPGRVSVVLGLLVALTVIGSSAVAVAIPVVRQDLDLTVSDAAWIFAVFQLSFAIATATFGRLADLQGLRRPLVVGVLLMSAGSIVVGLAPNLPVLLLGRAVQGIGGGAVPVLANGIIGRRFDGAVRAGIFGTVIAVVSAVSGAGPVIGGGIEALLGWRWVFAIPALGVLLLPAILPLAPTDRSPGTFDRRGAVTSGLAVIGVLLLLQSPSAGMVVGVVGALLVGVAMPLAVRHVRAHPHGFLPRSVVTDPVVVRAAAVGALALGGYFGALFAIPVLISDALGWSALQIGLALLPAAALGAVTSRVVGGRLGDGGHFRVVAAVTGTSAVAMLVAAAASAWVVALVVGLAGASVGFGGANVAMTDRVTIAAPADTANVTLGVFNMVQFAGGAAGSALIGGLSGLLPLPAALAATALLPGAAALIGWTAPARLRATAATAG